MANASGFVYLELMRRNDVAKKAVKIGMTARKLEKRTSENERGYQGYSCVKTLAAIAVNDANKMEKKLHLKFAGQQIGHDELFVLNKSVTESNYLNAFLELCNSKEAILVWPNVEYKEVKDVPSIETYEERLAELNL